ncbi:amidohydrolase [Novosphingobium sp. Gsoil 351]|uniref:amidohydrolase n=1 Tax=Novosphingobium sp. Gsoil 351 TaxID=2675225 RepID=UPI0012B5011A|nr:amidohydrolase [Novosphingobium sp. Gsoil 351]QGN56459.1 amidohydrolase family protein [Novosphingobium sp. Gsoil 351]
MVINVNGVTLDDKGQPQRFTALQFGPDGKVKALFQSKDKRPKTEYQIDGKGRTMIPGLIDAHLHVMQVGFAALTLDLSGTKSLAEAQDKVRAYAAAHSDRAWIVGRGWNQEAWGLGRFPTAAELDAAVAGRPVWLERVDGHAGWGNTAALAAAGVTATTKDPPGGRIERLPGGKPAGVLVDEAAALVARAVPAPRPDDRDLAFDTAQRLLFARGLTAVADMGTSIEDWQTYRRAGDAGRLRLRVMAYALGIEAMSLIGGPGPTPWLYDDRLRLNGLKLYADGALGSRGALLKAPYADAPQTRGISRIGETQLKNLMSRAAMDNFQIAVHAIGDGANAEVLDAIQDLAATYKGDRRWRIEHAQIVDPLDIPRFGRLGVIASMQPIHQVSDRTMAEARLGPARLAGAYAWKSLAAGGARLAFGSDAPVELPDPFAGMAAALTREDASGQPFGGWQPQERIDRTAALAGYTTGAAWAGFAERKFGRLAAGLRADFVLINVDPLLAPPGELRKARVLETWIGGEKVFEAARPRDGASVDESR